MASCIIELPPRLPCVSSFFFNAPATTEIYTLSLHDALPISTRAPAGAMRLRAVAPTAGASPATPAGRGARPPRSARSEEHTSELQSLTNLVCRLLLEKKKQTEITEEENEEARSRSTYATHAH